MRVGDWDDVVDEKDGPKLVSVQPIWQAWRVKACMPNIQVDFAPNIPFSLPATFCEADCQTCPDTGPSVEQQLE
jgi:hypothetical protein